MTSGQLHDELAKFGLKEPRETDTGALTAMVANTKVFLANCDMLTETIPHQPIN